MQKNYKKIIAKIKIKNFDLIKFMVIYKIQMSNSNSEMVFLIKKWENKILSSLKIV